MLAPTYAQGYVTLEEVKVTLRLLTTRQNQQATINDPSDSDTRPDEDSSLTNESQTLVPSKASGLRNRRCLVPRRAVMVPRQTCAKTSGLFRDLAGGLVEFSMGGKLI